MLRETISLLMVAVLVSVPSISWADEGPASKPAAAKSDALTDVARDLYDQGMAAMEKGEIEKAHASFLAAWRLKKHWQIAANLGDSLLKLDRPREAAEVLQVYAREAPADRQVVAQALFARATAMVANVQVNVDVAGAAVFVDGASVGTSPLAAPLFLDPGPHTVEITKDGFLPFTKKIDAQKGGSDLVDAKFTKRADAPQRSFVLPAVAFGVGGVGLVLGAVAAGVAIAGNDSLSKICTSSYACPPSARGQLETTVAMTHASTAGFVVASVGAALGVTLLLLPQKSAAPKAAVFLAPGFVGAKGVF